MSPNNFSDDSNESNSNNFEELRQKMAVIHDKLEGKNTDKISLEDVVQYVRAVNYNFGALSTIMNRILIEHSRIAMAILEKLNKIDIQFKEFFETNSFLDDVLKENKNDDANSKEN